MTPDTLLLLANLTSARRPDRGPRTYPDPLVSPAAAARALPVRHVERSQLDELRALQETVVRLVDGLLGGRTVARPAARLTELAQPSVATVGLDAGERTLRARLEWSEPAPGATLARRIVLELGEIELPRLKRCERSACELVFYDATRSRTQRWHAESPCGARERQERHRSRAELTRALKRTRAD